MFLVMERQTKLVESNRTEPVQVSNPHLIYNLIDKNPVIASECLDQQVSKIVVMDNVTQ